MPLPAALDDRERASQSFFDRWARTYDRSRISSWFQYTQELTIRSLDLKPDSWVLDVGCGTGYATRRIVAVASHGRACGVDISSAMVDAARRGTPPDLAAQVEFRQANSAELPYDNADVISSSEPNASARANQMPNAPFAASASRVRSMRSRRTTRMAVVMIALAQREPWAIPERRVQW